MCTKQTSVSHGSRESDVVSLDAGLRMDAIPTLCLLDVVIEVLYSSKNTHTHPSSSGRPLSNRKGRRSSTGTGYAEKSGAQIQTRSLKEAETETLMNSQMWITLSQTHLLLTLKPRCMFLKTTKVWSKWSKEAEVLRWDTCPEPSELR